MLKIFKMRIRKRLRGCTLTILYFITLFASLSITSYYIKVHIITKSNTLAPNNYPTSMVMETIPKQLRKTRLCLMDYLNNFVNPEKNLKISHSNNTKNLDDLQIDLNQTKWRRLSPNLTSLFVFSAYYTYDTMRGNHSIRIVGAINKFFDVNDFKCFTCFGQELDYKLSILPLNYIITPEHHNKDYKAVFLDCSLGHIKNYDRLRPIIPEIVVIQWSSLYNQSNASIMLKVRFGHLIENFSLLKNDTFDYPDNESLWNNYYFNKRARDYYSMSRMTKLSVCVKPFFGSLYSDMRLIEFFEMYKLLRASSITIYTHDTVPWVRNIMRMYEESGLLEVIDWTLPSELLPTNKKISVNAQVSSYHDCAHRYKHQSTYVAVVDLDEFLLPTRQISSSILSRNSNQAFVTLLSFIEEISKNFSRSYCGSYQFRNVFYDTSACVNNLTSSTSTKLLTLSCLSRQTFISESHVRSKEIIIPDLVDEVGIHRTHRFINPLFITCHVPTNLALNRHYRTPIISQSKKKLYDVVFDDSALMYGNQLRKNVALAFVKLRRLK